MLETQDRMLFDLQRQMNESIQQPSRVVRAPTVEQVEAALTSKAPLTVRLVTKITLSGADFTEAFTWEEVGKLVKPCGISFEIEDVELTTIKNVTKYADGGFRFVGSRMERPDQYSSYFGNLEVHALYADYTVRVPNDSIASYEKKEYGGQPTRRR